MADMKNIEKTVWTSSFRDGFREMPGSPAGSVAFLLSGIIALLTGLIRLVRFLRTHPKPLLEKSNG